MKRAVIYDRASSAGQRNNWSRDDASRIGAELAERHGYTWELRQEVKSGETLEGRPVMMKILKDVEAGLVDAIIVQDFTRLSRDEDGIDGRVIRNILRNHDCRVITSQKVYDFSLDADDDMADFNFLIGKIHKRQTVTALVRGMKERARQGKQITGGTLMGYQRVYDLPEKPGQKPIGHLVIDDQEAAVIRVLYDKYLELRSGSATARWLNDADYRKPVKSAAMQARYDLDDQRPFTRGDVLSTVKNPLYAGWATWGKKSTSRHMRDFEAEWQYRPDLQIVNQDQWDRANALAKRNARVPHRAVGSSYAFSMLLACRSCKGTLVGTSAMKPTGRHKKYRCSGYSKSGASVCESGQTINETVVARALIPFTARLIKEDLGGALDEAASEISTNLTDGLIQAWQAELADVERKIGNIVRAIARDTITNDQARAVMEELTDKRVRLQRNLAKSRETSQMRQDLIDAIPAILGDVEGVLWTFLKEYPKILNEILSLIYAQKSIVIEAWGPNSKRESRVVEYQLSEGFAEVLDTRVPTGEHNRRV